MTKRCPQCPGVNRIVEPTGPQPARVLAIGEAPGKDDNRRGQPFSGKPGIEIDQHYFPMAGLLREDVRVTNTVLCFSDHCKNNTPTEALVKSCSESHLIEELRYTQPEVIVAFGTVACSIFGIRGLDMYHGIPHWITYGDSRVLGRVWSGWVFPTYHPAAAMREPRMMAHIHSDMESLKLLLDGDYIQPGDAYPNPDYRHISNELEFEMAMRNDDAYDKCVELAKDTEATPLPLKLGWSPWCVTYSFRAGTGRLILASNTHLIKLLNDYIANRRPYLLYHNYLFDIAVETDMGLTACFGLPYTDTMVEAYHVGTIARGLKSLVYRFCGMVMEDFSDVVTPHSEGHALSHLLTLIDASKAYQAVNPYPCKRIKGERRTPLHKRIERIVNDYLLRGGYQPGHGYESLTEGGKKSVNLWDRWNKIKKTITEALEDENIIPDPLITGIDMDAIPNLNLNSELDAEQILIGDTDKVHLIVLPNLPNLPISNESRRDVVNEYEIGRRVKELVWLVNEYGDMPQKSIAHVPFDKALYYACRDADATIRLRPMLRELERRVRKEGKLWEI